MAYSIERLPERISIGRETETGVTDVMIDCGAWVSKWPGMTLHAIHTPEGGTPYILQTETVGSVLVWHVTDADTATPGTGLVEIVGETDGRRKVSAMVKVYVAARMSGTVGEPPEAAKPWADRVVEAAGRITGMKVQAETLDAGSGATAAWDGEQGLLTIGVPKGEQGPKGEKGEKGPQGEKGEPGKDAVVDATLTQSGQAADAKVTGDAIGQLKGDIAGKLPKSPANWEPWTAEEQAAARERMGIPGDYELIENIITTEETNGIQRSVEPDGTPYSFISVFVKIHCPAADYDGTLNVRYYNGYNSIIAYVTNAVSTEERFGISKVITVNGYLEAFGSAATTTKHTGLLSILATTYSEYLTKKGHINKIYLSLQGSKILPVGTEILIYGVRA